ncbi:LysR substrate-binding domain-containing protein [Streptomyces sp. NPDC055140]
MDGASAPDDLCAALKDIPLVTYAEGLPIVRRYWRLAFGKQLTTHAAVTVPNLSAVVSAVAAGCGYSVLPRSLCQDHLTAGTLALLHDPDEPPSTPSSSSSAPAPKPIPTSSASATPSATQPSPGRSRWLAGAGR